MVVKVATSYARALSEVKGWAGGRCAPSQAPRRGLSRVGRHARVGQLISCGSLRHGPRRPGRHDAGKTHQGRGPEGGRTVTEIRCVAERDLYSLDEWQDGIDFKRRAARNWLALVLKRRDLKAE